MAVAPIALVLAALAGLVLHGAPVRAAVERATAAALPPPARAQVDALFAAFVARTGLLGLISGGGLVWSGIRLFGALELALCHIFRAPRRPYLGGRLVALALMAALVTAVLLVALCGTGLAAVAALPARALVALCRPGAPGRACLPWLHWAGWLAGEAGGLVAGFALLALIYSLAPNRRMPPAAVWPGALVAACGFQTMTILFPLYTETAPLSAYGATPFGLLLVLLLWAYLASELTVLGAVIIALRLPPDAGRPAAAGARRPWGRPVPGAARDAAGGRTGTAVGHPGGGSR